MSHVRSVLTTSATRVALAACVLLLVSGSGLAQQRTLTIDGIYDPDQRADFSGRTPSGLTWLNDTRYLQRERDPASRVTRLLSVDADTGTAEPLLDVEELQTALAALPGMSEEAARRAVRAEQFDLMLYPRSRHGIREPELVTHLRHTMLEFILEHLQPAVNAERRTETGDAPE